MFRFVKTSGNCVVRQCGRSTCSSRKFSSQDNDNIRDISKISLRDEVPWLPPPIYAKASEFNPETKVTILKNGLKVASEPKFGSFSTIGVLVDSGSRYEVAYPSGICHFLEKLAFGDTTTMKRDDIKKTFQNQGGICDCQSSRDTFIYAVSVENTGLDKAIEILGEVTLRPQITEDEVIEAHKSVSFDLEDLQLRPEKDTILIEMIHAAAYRDNTLGLPKICPPQNLDMIKQSTLFTYLKHHHNPNRMVLAGVGVNHDSLVEAAQKYFVDKPPIWEENPSLVLSRKMDADFSTSQYTGGSLLKEEDLSDVSIGPNPLPELAHLVIGLESVGHQHDDFVTLCVLNMLMGGGGSFSAGGPGKGMYTRLYTNVLNRYHWMHNATAYNHAYSDSGVFCIHASAHPSHLSDLAQVLTKEMVAMAGPIHHTELKRAKKQLQSMLLMNLESKPVMFEDLGRQVLATGKRFQPSHFMKKINEVTSDDIMRVSSQMLRTKPSIAALGSLGRLPSLSDIEAALLHREGHLPTKSRYSIFR